MTVQSNVAVITGAASGIGRAMAIHLAQKGYSLFLTDLNEVGLIETALSCQSFSPHIAYLAGDLIAPDFVDKLIKIIFSTFRSVHFFYNIAGTLGQVNPLWEQTYDTFKHTLDVNVLAIFNVIKAIIPYLSIQKSPSHIVNMGSLFSVCATEKLSAYTASKHALLGMTESLYFDLKANQLSIDVSIVMPSFLSTNLVQDEQLKTLFSFGASPFDVVEFIENAVNEKQFYIFPDKHVLSYLKEKMSGMYNESHPISHKIQKIMRRICKNQVLVCEEEIVI